MKVYISLPITGHPIDEVRKKADQAKQQLSDMGHEPVSPLDVSPDPDAPYAEHIGRDIAALLVCDAALFLDGWRQSKGCRLEHAAAEIYEKKIFYSLDRIPNIDICPPDDCPYHVKDFKECKYQCQTIRPDGNLKINCTCDYFAKNLLIEFGNFKIK